MTDWAQIFTGLLLYAYDGIHQLRTRVFDNYQTCTVPLIKFVENYFFLENYVTSEGAVSQIVLYYQPLPITHYQESFYANNYFE